MKRVETANKKNTDAGDVRVEVLEEVLSVLERFPDKLRILREFIAEQLAPENESSVRSPVSPAA